MDNTGAVTEAAKLLNEGRTTFQGGAALAAKWEERRDLIKLCRADEFLDELHLQDCIEETATWAPDVMRQKMLRKMGGATGRSHVLRPDQVAELLVHIRRFRGDAPPARA